MITARPNQELGKQFDVLWGLIVFILIVVARNDLFVPLVRIPTTLTI